MTPRGDIVAFMVVIGLALFFAEMQTRTTATTRWILLAILWVILTAMMIFVASG
jgi:hypothetical protein